MNTKNIAIIAVFAALAIVLNLSPFKIPAPYAPFLIYQIWEIPIVVAFILYGARIGVVLAVVNTIALLVVYPGALPTGPFYNLAAVLSMISGIGMAGFLIRRHSPNHNEAVVAAALTASGVTLRAVAMAFLNWALLRFPSPIGYSMPEFAIMATMPLVVIFNVTLALYTIPIGYGLAKIVEPRVKALA
jgi:riboflavin transporter FmnP